MGIAVGLAVVVGRGVFVEMTVDVGLDAGNSVGVARNVAVGELPIAVASVGEGMVSVAEGIAPSQPSNHNRLNNTKYLSKPFIVLASALLLA